MSNFTNTKIKDTFQRVLQIDNGEIQDGLGLPVDARIQSIESDLGFTGDLDGTATLAIGLTSGDKIIQGNLDVIGKLTAIEIYAQYESSSIIFSSGSTKFGDTFDDTHQFTGSVSITGSSFSHNGYNVITSNDTGSIVVNSASYAQTASYIQLSGVDGFTVYSSSVSNRVTNLENFSSSLDATFATDAQLNAATASLSSSIASLSSSYLFTSASFSSGINANTNGISALSSSFISFSGSYNTGSFTGSFTGNLTGTSSYAVSASHALNADNAISASYALTASHVNPLNQAVIITGSLNLTGSAVLTGSTVINSLTYPTVDNGEFSFMQTDGLGNLTLQYVNTLYEIVYNGEATQLTKGTPVYISGSQGANSKAYRADAGDPTKMPVVYVTADNIDPADTGRGIALGLITGVDTTGYPGGTEIYVGVGGGFTSVRPTGSAIVQILGYVTKEGSGGQGVILNPGPANLPNITSGSVWVGNSGSVPIMVPTSSLSVASAVTASFAQTASLAPNYVLTSVTSSMLAPYVLTSQTSSMSVASASVATSASYALTASFALNGGGTVNTGSLLTTASVSLNTITFTKGDGSTFPITVNTGSGGGGGSSFPFTGSAIISGSLEVIGSTNLNGTLNLDTNPSTASLGPGLTTNLLSISSSQVNFDFDQLEGDFDLVQTGSQSVTGAVTASYFKGDGTEISGISAINWFLS
jgi:hypothetical protein